MNQPADSNAAIWQSGEIAATGAGPPSKPRWTWLSIRPGMMVEPG